MNLGYTYVVACNSFIGAGTGPSAATYGSLTKYVSSSYVVVVAVSAVPAGRLTGCASSLSVRLMSHFNRASEAVAPLGAQLLYIRGNRT